MCKRKTRADDRVVFLTNIQTRRDGVTHTHSTIVDHDRLSPRTPAHLSAAERSVARVSTQQQQSRGPPHQSGGTTLSCPCRDSRTRALASTLSEMRTLLSTNSPSERKSASALAQPPKKDIAGIATNSSPLSSKAMRTNANPAPLRNCLLRAARPRLYS
jgi:hypothetical protein